MELDEAKAYAIAAWSSYEGEVSDDLLRAICGAFAIVAAADGNVAQSEIDQFLDIISQHFRPITQLELDQVRRLFDELVEAILSDPEEGFRRALDDIATVRDSETDRQIVRTAAELAIVADHRVRPTERKTADAINRALGLV